MGNSPSPDRAAALRVLIGRMGTVIPWRDVQPTIADLALDPQAAILLRPGKRDPDPDRTPQTVDGGDNLHRRPPECVTNGACLRSGELVRTDETADVPDPETRKKRLTRRAC